MADVDKSDLAAEFENVYSTMETMAIRISDMDRQITTLQLRTRELERKFFSLPEDVDAVPEQK